MRLETLQALVGRLSAHGGGIGSAADDALQVIEANAASSHTDACLADATVAAIAAAGTNRLLLPEALGGLQANPIEAMRAISAISAIDGSAGWCTAISIGGGLFARYVREEAARAAFTDPDAPNAGVFAALGTVNVTPEGARLSGRWPFASNCLHSKWIGLGALSRSGTDEPDPAPRLVLVQRSDVNVDLTWDGGGLRGTGSHHVEVRDLAVDLDLSCAFTDTAWPQGTLWRLPVFTALAPLLVSAPLGIARAAIDHVFRRIREGAAGMRGSLGDDQVGLAELAEADSELRAADSGLEAAVEDSWAAAEARDRVSRVQQARTILSVHHAMDVSVRATSTAHRLCGGSAAFEGHRVLIALRDVETARQHVLFGHQHRPQLTRIAAGVDAVAPPFVV